VFQMMYLWDASITMPLVELKLTVGKTLFLSLDTVHDKAELMTAEMGTMMTKKDIRKVVSMATITECRGRIALIHYTCPMTTTLAMPLSLMIMYKTFDQREIMQEASTCQVLVIMETTKDTPNSTVPTGTKGGNIVLIWATVRRHNEQNYGPRRSNQTSDANSERHNNNGAATFIPRDDNQYGGQRVSHNSMNNANFHSREIGEYKSHDRNDDGDRRSNHSGHDERRYSNFNGDRRDWTVGEKRSIEGGERPTAKRRGYDIDPSKSSFSGARGYWATYTSTRVIQEMRALYN
jgi:hypothetical protein